MNQVCPTLLNACIYSNKGKGKNSWINKLFHSLQLNTLNLFNDRLSSRLDMLQRLTEKA